MNDASFDLDAETRRALEWDTLLEWVGGFAATVHGRAWILGLPLRAEAGAIAEELAAVEETLRHLSEDGRLVQGRLPDPTEALAALSVAGARIEPKALRDLATSLAEASDLRARLLRAPAVRHPRLRRIAAELPDLGREAREILHHIAPDGRVLDGASPELSRLRQAIARVGDKLRRLLESFLHEPGADHVIRDDFVTQRGGRFVIPVRSDAPRADRGIVHATSSSGATLFVEPFESVEMNNELVRLTDSESEEVVRVLLGWSDTLRARKADVLGAVEGLARIDALQARALFGNAVSGCLPSVAHGGAMRVRDLRHPLLDRRLNEQGGTCVPLTLELDPADRVLVISGPNTGGKTVALKTLGLAVLMAQGGIPVPASEARLPLYRQLRADIGDHQSIDADLSTFSAHVRAVARFLEVVEAPALLLFDEIGTGTEPTEGAALAQAVLERLSRQGLTTVATTHQGALKSWAFTNAQAASAAMEFDAVTLRPTYRILMHVAGVSAGVDIAERLGLEPTVVARARDLLGPAGQKAEAYLTRLRELTSELAQRTEALAARERRMEDAEREREAEASKEASRRRQRAEERLERVFSEFREQVSRELEGIQDRKERARLEREQFRAEMRLKEELAIHRRAAEDSPTAEAVPDPAFEPRAGQKVRIISLGREGEVLSVRGERVEVRLGAATIAVKRIDLLPASPGPDASVPTARKREGWRGGKAPDSDLVGAPREIILIGMTVDEALPKLDKFLDDASLAGASEVRIVHGHGTGRLRGAIRGFLAGHPHVESHRPGEPREGGDGATVARLH